MDQDSDSRSSSPIRLPQARTSCDLCKRLKIKCERQGESCVHCIDRGAKCETTLVERKKRQMNRGSSLVDIESRIKRMESVITASGLSSHQSIPENTATGTSDPPLSGPSKITDRLATLLISESGNSRFLGASSGFSLFSPQGLQWISERTGSKELPQFISSLIGSIETPSLVRNAQVWRTMFPSEREPLPPKEIASRYVHAFFESFNVIFPLYDRATFDRNFDDQYSGKPLTGPAWYASLNSVLCLGSMICRVHSPEEDDKHSEDPSWKYFRNASSCFVDLLFQDYSLLAVQAICGMAFIRQITMEPQSLYVLAAAAARLAYGIGLHRNMNEFGLSQAEIDQRENVFWIVYFMDKSVALRLGHPSVINDDDIGIDLPQEKTFIEVRPDGSTRYGIFRCQIQLAMLESRIYSELYSARSLKRSTLDRLRSIGELDKALLEWKEALPLEIRPEKALGRIEAQFLPIVMMHFAYFNCITTIHRISVHHGSWASSHLNDGRSTLHDRQLNPRVYASQTICLTAARQSIQILKCVSLRKDMQSYNIIMMLLYYPLSGFLTLFANCLQNPQDSHVYDDLTLMDYVTSYLSPDAVQVTPLPVAGALIFRELGSVARKFVEKTNMNVTKATKRTHDGGLPKQEVQQVLSYAAPDSSKTIDPSLQSNINLGTSDSMISATDTSYHHESPTGGLFDLSTTENQQNHLEPLNNFGGDTLPMSDSSLFPNNDMRQPNLPPNPPLFAEYFEWDLANLWNLDVMQGL